MSSTEPGEPATPVEVVAGMWTAAHRIGAEIERSVAGFHGISFGDLVLLHELLGPDGETPTVVTRGALAARWGISVSVLVRRLRPLQRMRIVAEPAQLVGSSTEVTLTESGAQLIHDAWGTANIVAQRLLWRLPDTDKQTIASLLSPYAGDTPLT